MASSNRHTTRDPATKRPPQAGTTRWRSTSGLTTSGICAEYLGPSRPDSRFPVRRFQWRLRLPCRYAHPRRGTTCRRSKRERCPVSVPGLWIDRDPEAGGQRLRDAWSRCLPQMSIVRLGVGRWPACRESVLSHQKFIEASRGGRLASGTTDRGSAPIHVPVRHGLKLRRRRSCPLVSEYAHRHPAADRHVPGCCSGVSRSHSTLGPLDHHQGPANLGVDPSVHLWGCVAGLTETELDPVGWSVMWCTETGVDLMVSSGQR